MAELGPHEDVSPELREALQAAKVLHRQAREGARRLAQLRDEALLDPEKGRALVAEISRDLKRQAYAAANRFGTSQRLAQRGIHPAQPMEGSAHDRTHSKVA